VKEKLSKFTSLFSEKIEDYVNSAQENLENSVAKFEKWKELRAKAIELESDPGLIDRVFLETGGINNDLFRNSTDALYASGDELKSVVKKLFKVNKGPIYVNNAQRRLDSANSLKSAGGESYFNSLMQALGSTIAGTNDSQAIFDKLINSDSSDFSDFWSTNVDSPDGPRGLISSVEFFEAVKENGNPLSTITVSEGVGDSPLNPADSLSDEPTGISPINEETSPNAENEEMSPLNPDGGQSSSVDVGITTSTVSGSPVNLPEEEQPAASESIINIESSPEQKETISQENTIFEKEIITSPISDTPTLSTQAESSAPVQDSPINEISTSSIFEKLNTDRYSEFFKAAGIEIPNESQISEILNDFSQNETSAINSNEVTQNETSAINLAEVTQNETSAINLNEVTQNETSAINLNEVTQNEGEANIQDSPVNEVSTKSIFEKLNTGKYSEFFKSAGIEIPNESKISEIINSTSSTSPLTMQSTLDSDSNQGMLGLTKDLVKMPTESPGISTPQIEQTASSSQDQPISVQQADSTSLSPVESKESEFPKGSPNVSEQAGSTMSADFSKLEEKLSRIEFILSGPLDVKIID
jgi:hypothetical protein